MDDNSGQTQRQSPLHAFLSFLLPGLGQLLAGQWARAIYIFSSVVVLGLLSIWTITQRARFPEEYYASGAQAYVLIVLQFIGLLVFLIALRSLILRFMVEDAATQAFSQIGLFVLYVVAIFIVSDSILALSGDEETLGKIFGGTAVYSGAAMAAFWLWQAVDAGRIGADKEIPSFAPGILILCVLIFSLGYRITEIDLPKAIREYQDTRKILVRIFWPWEAAFEFEQITVETSAKIQAPCPEGATGPEPNEPKEGEPWVVVTPTCGDLTERDLQGNVTLGTLLTIRGGGFTPGQVVEIKWKNPIGNPFTPRGVGETDITVNEDGEFESTLYIPEVTVAPDTAVGAQIHTLSIIEESEEVFTGNLSSDMIEALKRMLETIMLGLMATFFGIVLAFPISFLAARNIMTPITSPLNSIVGGLLSLFPALWLVTLGTRQVSLYLGGLESAPIQIALALLILILGLGYAGTQLGGRLFVFITERLPEIIGRLLVMLGFGLLAALPGYLLGLGFSRGVVAIPVGAEEAAQTESLYAIGGAVLFGLLGALYAYFKGIAGEVPVGTVVYSIMRTVMNIVRSIEPLIWAIVATIWVGLGPFAGTIALTLHTIAALGKLYSESIESIDPGPIEAIQATGANRLQTVIYAVVPQILPPFISFTIYRWDINVRLSTIIGLVGGGGIGFLLIQWIRQFQYDQAGIAVWLITITVSALDYISSNIRERYV